MKTETLKPNKEDEKLINYTYKHFKNYVFNHMSNGDLMALKQRVIGDAVINLEVKRLLFAAINLEEKERGIRESRIGA
ncbi:hypothetical protein [Cellulosilyticum sp. I15G10I2]|uniref:hypothetical protein n=1 Tax=Cellulosilyticum sp. I15G10I2 TaxID=1892843 RepID=UPI00085BBB41|nr:hypothetical protein [Cellulosilyticum sp. I15G10I2]